MLFVYMSFCLRAQGLGCQMMNRTQGSLPSGLPIAAELRIRLVHLLCAHVCLIISVWCHDEFDKLYNGRSIARLEVDYISDSAALLPLLRF